MAGDLNMSKLEQRPFEEQLANVIYANRLEQAETRGKEEGIEQGIEQGRKEGIKQGIKQIIGQIIDQGIEQGIEQGERNIIIKLLKKNTPEEICAIYDIPLEKIRKVQNSKSI